MKHSGWRFAVTLKNSRMQKSGMRSSRVELILCGAEDRGFCERSGKVTAREPWDSTRWKTWTDALKLRVTAKANSFHAAAFGQLNGLDHGPELAAILPLIGRQKVMDRLV